MGRRGWKIDDLPEHLRPIARHKLAGGGDDAASEALFAATQNARMPVEPVRAPPAKRTRSRLMNKTEAAYAAELATRKAAGEVLSFEFEAIKLNIGERSWYTPDFFVVAKRETVGPFGCVEIEFHEVKGDWRAKNQRDGRTRIKAAAKQYPQFKFVAVQKVRLRDGGGWKHEAFGGR